MNSLVRRLRICAAAISICALLTPSLANAKPLDAATVHEKIAKQGVGKWVCVEQRNGIALIGRIISIDDQSFSLQLSNYPEATPILYQDVTKIRFGLSKTATFTIVGATAAIGLIAGLVMHHEFEVNKAQLPSTPTQPVFP